MRLKVGKYLLLQGDALDHSLGGEGGEGGRRGGGFGTGRYWSGRYTFVNLFVILFVVVSVC